jgi:predicted  nucleic acid-binding Zn-ribbon protein
VNESLLHLYELQKIDSQLDELIENRGELPQHVDDLRQMVVEQRARLLDADTHVAEVEKRSAEVHQESIELREKVEKYKAQQFDVKTTREYDAITFQLDDAQKRLSRHVDESARLGLELEQTRVEATTMREELVEMDTDLANQEVTLTSLMAETEQDEKELLKKRAATLKLVRPNFIGMYDRVRPAKNGIAVVPVRNGVCGGCFNAIPRQLVLELKKGDKHAVCEYCGRIIVGEPISLAVDGEPVPLVHSDNTEEEEAEG